MYTSKPSSEKLSQGLDLNIVGNPTFVKIDRAVFRRPGAYARMKVNEYE
jgi:hypothetical protein